MMSASLLSHASTGANSIPIGAEAGEKSAGRDPFQGSQSKGVIVKGFVDCCLSLIRQRLGMNQVFAGDLADVKPGLDTAGHLGSASRRLGERPQLEDGFLPFEVRIL